MTAVVSLDGARVERDHRTVWRDVDLAIEPGEFVAILGPNGVGKSTLLSVILGVLPLAAGRATVLGATPGTHNHQIGYLPQRRHFDASLRVRGVDIVALGLDGDHWGFPVARPSTRRARNRRVEELVDLVDARDYAYKPIGECSGGEQQRLLIAQALAREPSLLLLDEPLDSLDLGNQASVAALIGRLSRERGITVMIVAHDVNPILPYLDRVVYLGRGGAVCGAPDAVITSETLSRLYDAPIEVLHATDGRLVVVGQPDVAPFHPDLHPSHGHGHEHGH
jgi:zinc/manganese transport system ATP-binding protein